MKFMKMTTMKSGDIPSDVKININTIAREARVSTTTVSNFINGTEVLPISPETRGRLKGVMRKLNYRPHIGGVLMRRNAPRRGKVGFVMGEDCMSPVFHTVGIPLVQRFLCELELKLDRELDMSLEILRVDDEDSRAEWNAKLLDLDFVINFGQLNALMCDTLSRRNLPLLEVYSTDRFRVHGELVEDEYDFIYWRNDAQIAAVFDCFYRRGKRNFLFVSSCNVEALRPDYYGYDAQAKLEGFERALSAHPDAAGTVLSPHRTDDFNMFAEFRLTRELLTEHRAVLAAADAVICHNDIVAHGAASILMESGRLPGRDLELAGEGHYRELQHWFPAITTSCVDYTALTMEICRLIRMRQNGGVEPPVRMEIPTVMVEPCRNAVVSGLETK